MLPLADGDALASEPSNAPPVVPLMITVVGVAIAGDGAAVSVTVTSPVALLRLIVLIAAELTGLLIPSAVASILLLVVAKGVPERLLPLTHAPLQV